MKAASVSEVKIALAELPQPKLVELCVRLAKFKKENKELLTFLLFEADEEQAYLKQVKEEMDLQFATVNWSHIYFAKKSIRKILRLTNKHCKYVGSKQAEADLLVHFCLLVRSSPISLEKSTALFNIYKSQAAKIEKLVAGFHEDLQYDYKKTIARL